MEVAQFEYKSRFSEVTRIMTSLGAGKFQTVHRVIENWVVGGHVDWHTLSVSEE